MEYQSGMDGHRLRDEVTTSIRVNLFIPRAESVPCCGCFSLICICSSNASLSAHQANANLSFPKRARPRSPAYVDRFRSENLIIYILLVAHDGIFWVHANTRPRRPADAHLQREALIRLHKPAKRKVYLPQTVASATSGRIFCPFMPLVHSQQRPKRLSISSTGLIGRIHTDGSLRQASEVNSYRSEVASHWRSTENSLFSIPA